MAFFRLFIFFLLPFSVANAQSASSGGGIQFVHENFKEALDKAQKEKKIIFMDAYTTWCGPCKMMSKNVFPDADVAKLYNTQFINLKMDMEKGDGIELMKRYEVSAFPTLLFLDGNGQLIHKAVGYLDAKGLIDLGKTALDADKSLGAWTTKYENGNKDAAFLKEYAFKLAAAYDKRRFKVAEDYLATQSDWNTPENLDFIYHFTEGVDSKFFDYLLKNKKAFENKFGASEIEVKIQGLVSDNLFDEKNLPSLGFADTLIQKVYPTTADQTAKKYRMSYFRMKGDREKYADAAITYFKKYNKSAEELGEAANTFFEQIEDKKLLKKALDWSKKAVKIDNSYFNNLTLANIHQSLDKKSKAIKAAQKAIDIAKKNGETYGEAEELLKSLK
jgi:thioredoxin-related protein